MDNKYYKKVYLKSGKKERVKHFLKRTAVFCFLGLLISIMFSLSIFVYYAKDLPRPEKFAERPFAQPTRIYDRTGEIVLYVLYGEEKRDLTSIEEIPEHLKNAVISTEDSGFYNHFGVDFRGITRSLLENLRRGRTAQGGSTISQQLIRSSLLSGEKTIGRKIREVILALELERRYSKDEILEFYLNQIPLGSNAYGVEAAAQTYFNKTISEISVPEAAILASLIRSPSSLSPYGPNLEKLIIRKDYVLDRMLDQGYLSQKEVEEYKEQEINFSPINQYLKAPHFTLEVISYLTEEYGDDYLRTRGLQVYTTLDWDLQQAAEKTVKEAVARNRSNRAFNAALAAVNPKNGEILAMVGSADYFKDPLPEGCTPGKNCLFEPYPNVAMRPRQPGSAFKPFLYADVFKKGYSDTTIILDEPITFSDGYSPRNFDGAFRGPVTIRQALAQSLNVPAIRAITFLSSVEDTLKTAQDLGITTLTRPASFYRTPLALGSGEVTVLDMASAYGTFANDGYAIAPSFVIKITDSQGRIIEENKREPRKVLNASVAQLISDILSDNDARGPMMGYNSPLNLPGTSVKTGTTQDFKDAWTVGYTSSISVGFWTGNNDNTTMIRGESLNVASPAWRSFMEYALSRR
jgi:1A family penicillin-binding protein